MKITSSQTFTQKGFLTLLKKQSLVWQRPGFLVALMAGVYLAIGLLTVTQYSQSVDEPPRMEYAAHSLSAYAGKIEYLVDEKGPFYGMLALIGSNVLVRLFPGWIPLDGWHFMTFVSFVFGVYFFYRLCRRLVDPAPAVAATLLFSSQPLLWGHAFINPKDIPFMAMFMASVCLGLEMVDYLDAQFKTYSKGLTFRSELSTLGNELANAWRSASERLRKVMKGLVGFLAAVWLTYLPLKALLSWLVTQVYTAPPSSWLGRLFHQTASRADQVPVQNYISKAQTLYSRIELSASILLVLAGILVGLLIFSSVRNRIVHVLVQPRVLLAGCFIGFCSDIRTLGPASALLVAVYFLVKSGRKAVPYLLVYFGVGALSIYAFWPYLWTAPIANFSSSLTQAADFPWKGHLMFAGTIYSPGTQPSSYLPVLFTVQFTETALALIVAGILLAGFYLLKRASLRMDVLLLGAWFLAPLAAAVVLHSVLYNNFRQFLFVVPPLFVFAALALHELWRLLKRRGILFVPLVILMLIPGIYWDWQLHPYQYIYYNSLVGGVAGASRNYDLDYWNSAYKDALEYVNKIAPEKTSISFWSNKRIIAPYARPDTTLLLMTNTNDPGGSLNTLTNYAILTSQDNADLLCFPASKEIYRIQRGGATLAVVKQVNKGDPIGCN